MNSAHAAYYTLPDVPCLTPGYAAVETPVKI